MNTRNPSIDPPCLNPIGGDPMKRWTDPSPPAERPGSRPARPSPAQQLSSLSGCEASEQAHRHEGRLRRRITPNQAGFPNRFIVHIPLAYLAQSLQREAGETSASGCVYFRKPIPESFLWPQFPLQSFPQQVLDLDLVQEIELALCRFCAPCHLIWRSCN